MRTTSTTEIIGEGQWRAYARRLERYNLRVHGMSPTSGSIARAANKFVIELLPGLQMRVWSEWREAMRARAAQYDT